MTSFGYWAGRVPHGQFLCCLCFEAYPMENAATDNDGDRIDICTGCWSKEKEAT